MISNMRKMRSVILSLGLFGCLMPSATLGSTNPGLIKYVPADVFLCEQEKTNPERQFVDDYWKEVCDAFKATGLSEEFMSFVGGFLSDGQGEQVVQLKDKVTMLIDGVDWKSLAAKETLFAQRMANPNINGSSINMGPPDMVWLLRGDANGAAKNFKGLSSIFHAAAEEINGAVGQKVVVVAKPDGFGDNVLTLAPAMMPLDQAPASLSLALRNDIIIIAVGRDMLKETLDLIQGRSEAKSLADSPRFKMALAGLPVAEDGLSFFDMQAMLKPVKKLATAAMASGSSDKLGKTNEAATALNGKALKAYNEKDIAKALAIITEAHDADPNSGLVMYNLACFSALSDKNEEALNWLTKAVDAGFHNFELMSSDEDLKALRNDAKFKSAIAKAKMTRKGSGAAKVDPAKMAIVNRIFNTVGIMDYTASVSFTEGRATHSASKMALVKDAASNPFYPVIASNKSLKQYSRHLPKETESFSVSSSIDPVELYHFILDTVKMIGPDGEAGLQQWTMIQEQNGFNLERDLLSLFEGEFVSMSIAGDMGLSSVSMIKVANEDSAREKMIMALNHLSAAMQQAATQQPMMAMFALRTSDSTDERLPGFQAVSIGGTTMYLGVVDGYLMMGDSADAIALCRDTAAGKHPNITKNQRIMNMASIPQGSFTGVEFTDKRNTGKTLAGLISGISMGGSMAMMAIPDPQQQKMLVKVLGMIAKLAPVAQKINFYESSSSYTTFDGMVWMTKEVTNYREKEHRASAN